VCRLFVFSAVKSLSSSYTNNFLNPAQKILSQTEESLKKLKGAAHRVMVPCHLDQLVDKDWTATAAENRCYMQSSAFD